MKNLAHVFHDKNLAFILIFAVFELWLTQHYTVSQKRPTYGLLYL